MRVRLDTNDWADFGAIRYKVEWETINTQRSDNNDFNYDDDLTAHARCFPESEYNLARAFAQQVLNHNSPFCGLVSITQQIEELLKASVRMPNREEGKPHRRL